MPVEWSPRRARGSCGRQSSAESSKHPELFDGRLHGGGCRVPEPTDRRVAHRLREVVDEGVFGVCGTARRTGGQTVQRFFLTDRADATRYTLTARLVTEEFGDPHRDVAQ